jgi:hypothetical protein
VPIEPGYDSDGSETMDTKQAIEQYKRAAGEHALLGLNNTSEEDTTVQPTATNNEDTPEIHPYVDDDSFDSESN